MSEIVSEANKMAGAKYTYFDIAELNNISDPDVIKPGNKIFFPDDVYDAVRKKYPISENSNPFLLGHGGGRLTAFKLKYNEAKGIGNPLSDVPGYIDVNASLGLPFIWSGPTGGCYLTFEGIYYYHGGGVILPPGPGASLTFSSGKISETENFGFQFGAIVGTQFGQSWNPHDVGESGFWEIGIMTPGVSFTGYNIKPFIRWESLITFYNLFFPKE